MIQSGLEVFLDSPDYGARNIALIANQTSATSDFLYGWDAMRKKGLRLKKIFSPEHGIYSTEQDQVPVADQPDPGCPIVSLYGDRHDMLAPDLSLLEGIDCVVFDIQDVGARYYTYVNTMILFMQRIAGSGVEFIVLDRPNPIGGAAVEGPLLKPGYESFCGVMPVAVRHGLTAGELAVMAKNYFHLDIALTVVRMRGWRRDMAYADAGLPWIPPSPNMPVAETALVYPGFCLFEGLNVSEGRGTTTPFRIIGAPFIEPFSLATDANALKIPGVSFRPTYFKPVFNKYSGISIGGIYIHVTHPVEFKPFLAAVALIRCIHERCGELEFLTGVYEFNDTHPAFDLLAGSDALRSGIDRGRSLDDLAAVWEKEERDFAEKREQYLMYR